MKQRQKLELVWPGKEDREAPEPRILLEKQVYKAQEKGQNDNLLIRGDNLLGLKALERDYAGKIKCVYIDPPYNTKSCFTHYNDSMEHTLWLNMMKERLIILSRLLREDGFICCHIDDNESHYLKALMDEIFGRKNYLTTLYVQVRYESKHLKRDMTVHKIIEQIFVYKKSAKSIPILKKTAASLEKYQFYVKELLKGKSIEIGNKKVEIFSEEQFEIIKSKPSKNGLKEIWASGTILDGNSSGRFFRDFLSGRSSKDGLGVLYKVYGIGDDGLGFRYFTGPKRKSATKGKYYQGIPQSSQTGYSEPIINFLDLSAEFGNCGHEGDVEFRSGKKPESLVRFLLEHFSSPGEIVLDCFAGSGTTGAVAHKMKRRWVMIEMEKHAETHIIPRLTKVIAGEDLNGISSLVNWKGGGAFRYCELAPSLLERNRLNRWVISKKYNPIMLAEAICLHAGFKFAIKRDPWWMHGYATEQDFIYATASSMSRVQLAALSEEVGPNRTLLIYCGAFKADPDEFPNLTLKKIPKAILRRCEWGRDDYSLKKELRFEAKAANRRKKRENVSSGEIIRAPIAAQGRFQ